MLRISLALLLAAVAARGADQERVVTSILPSLEYGGAFKITQGFVEEFGNERVRNTPICESAIVGAAMGLSINDGVTFFGFFTPSPLFVVIFPIATTCSACVSAPSYLPPK